MDDVLTGKLIRIVGVGAILDNALGNEFIGDSNGNVKSLIVDGVTGL